MSGSQSGAEDRTEAPTQRRRDQAREEGQLPVSRDLTVLASLGGAAAGALTVAPQAGGRLAGHAASLLDQLGAIHLDSGGLWPPLADALLSAGLTVASIAFPAALCAVLCVLVQTQFYIGTSPIRFQLSRLSPAAGLGRIFSQRHLLDFLKSCLRLGILGLLVWLVLSRRPFDSIAAAGLPVAALLPAAGDQVQGFVRPLMVALACFAALDVFLVRFQHTKAIRMTREQVRQEARESEGDPFIKGKLRRLREQRSRRRMMAKVKAAAVVVTNPTHYAVALSYDRGGSAAPKVVAKGADFVAARIREEATAHGVPLVPNPPLARALYQVELDREIPAEHYRAVAEVIAFVWKLKNRMETRGRL